MSGPTFNSTNTTGNTYSGTTGNVSITGVSAGDTILVFVNNSTNAASTLIPTSVNDGAAYAQVVTSSAAFNNSLTCFALTNATAGTHTATVTFASSVSFSVIWLTYSNASGSSVDQFAGGFQTGVTTFTQTVTNVRTNDTVVSVLYAGGGTSVASQTGTARFTGGGLGVGAQAQDQVQSGTGAISPNIVMSASTFGNFIVVSLQNNAATNTGNFFMLPNMRR
jgi:hypothetical protein